MATDYYANKLDQGQGYQDYVAWRLCHEGIPLVNFQTRGAQLVHGENALGVEIKFDDWLERSGNLWIEIQEKTDANQRLWVASGIFRSDNAWLYAIGNYSELFLFSLKRLREVRGGRLIIENNMHTSRGFLLSRAEAAREAERLFFWPDGVRGFQRGPA
jgi:hypothetical protein